jgi:undecaprenyl diphosphate synthase
VKNLPAHVAIIMDGNGRWAERRGLPRLAGHLAGVNRIGSVVATLLNNRVEYVTLYGFSSENWNRPEEEVQGLFQILEERIDQEAAEMHKRNIRIKHLGRLQELPSGVQNSIRNACNLTQNNNGMVLNFAFNYGGRNELVDTARQLIEQKIPAEKIDEKVFAANLYTAGIPDVDLVIRTGGELRISNFLLWQAAYAEFYFTQVLWPSFTPKQVKRALQAFGERKRRFGGI